MNIKVCGITQLKQLQQLDSLDVDFAGLIFYKKSPRYAGDKINGKDVQSADFDLRKVGVFVNADYDEIMETVEEYALDVVQLHGNESPDLCEQLQDETEVIKAIHINETQTGSIDKLLKEYDDACDYYLFDTAAKGDAYGGTGKQFDWTILRDSKIEKPFFISGGIGLNDAEKIKTFKHPDFYGIDVNSQFEKEPGIKDLALLLQFKLALKK